ncbi:MAG: RNA 2',3'-cyclic phosphodiesterase [Planctomycetota bacterium]
MTRAFLGLALPARTAATLAEAARSALGPGTRDLRLCASIDLHLTLCFLGEVGPDVLARIVAQMRTVDVVAPRLVIDHTGAFPTRAEPRVLWAGVSGAPVELERLASLVQTTERWARDAGVAVESADPYVPHITLARARERTVRDLNAFFALAPALPWRPEEITLFASQARSGDETRYPVLASAPLRRAR